MVRNFGYLIPVAGNESIGMFSDLLFGLQIQR
jgi:hypothetical protein